MDTLEKFRKDETRRLICWIRKNKIVGWIFSMLLQNKIY